MTVHSLNGYIQQYNFQVSTPVGSRKDYVCPPYEYQELGDLCGPKSSTYARWANYNITTWRLGFSFLERRVRQLRVRRILPRYAHRFD